MRKRREGSLNNSDYFFDKASLLSFFNFIEVENEMSGGKDFPWTSADTTGSVELCLEYRMEDRRIIT